MKFIKKFLKLIIVLAVIAGIAILGIKAIKAKKAKEAQTPQAKVYEVVAKTEKFTPKKVKLTLPYLSQVENEQSVKVASRVAARVVSLKRSGEKVKKGEIVAKLDTTDIQAKIDALNISLNNLYQTHKRTEALYRVKAASVEQLQNEESKIASLKSQLASLKNQLSYAQIVSPVDGVVSKTLVSEGSVAMPGKPLLEISSNSGYALLVRLPQGEHADSIIYQGKNYPLHDLHTTFHGLHEYKAYVDSKGLSSGELVDVTVVLMDKTATLLPFDAILNRGDKNFVLIAKDHKAEPKEVHILQSGEEGIVLKEDISGQNLVVAKPDIMLKLLGGASLRAEK